MKITSNIRNLTLILITAGIVGCSGAAQQEDVSEEVMTAPASAPVLSKSDSNYQVERGDSLWGISGKAEVYANPYLWPLIYKNNTGKIEDADLIYPGQVFDIDNNSSSSEDSAAVQHAKTRGRWSIGVTEQSDKAYLR